MKTKQEGYLGYNCENDRYGFLVSDLWEIDGFHCGQSFEILIDGEWIHTRIEMDIERRWYLVGTDLVGKDLEHQRIRV